MLALETRLENVEVESVEHARRLRDVESGVNSLRELVAESVGHQRQLLALIQKDLARVTNVATSGLLRVEREIAQLSKRLDGKPQP